MENAGRMFNEFKDLDQLNKERFLQALAVLYRLLSPECARASGLSELFCSVRRAYKQEFDAIP